MFGRHKHFLIRFIYRGLKYSDEFYIQISPQTWKYLNLVDLVGKISEREEILLVLVPNSDSKCKKNFQFFDLSIVNDQFDFLHSDVKLC